MAQMSMSPDMDENYRKTIHFMNEAEGCDLLFFPEIQWTPFFLQYRKEELTGKTGLNPEKLPVKSDDPRITMLCRLCADKRMYLSPNLYVETDGKKYDMSLMIDDCGRLLGMSRWSCLNGRFESRLIRTMFLLPCVTVWGMKERWILPGNR